MDMWDKSIEACQGEEHQGLAKIYSGFAVDPRGPDTLQVLFEGQLSVKLYNKCHRGAPLLACKAASPKILSSHRPQHGGTWIISLSDAPEAKVAAQVKGG